MVLQKVSGGNFNGCAKNHHNLLNDTKLDGKQPGEKVAETKESDKQLPNFPGEGAVGSRTNVTTGKKTGPEVFSLRSVPVWLKKNNCKVKVNEILDNPSNETFLNEEVAGMLGIQEPFQTVKVHVLTLCLPSYINMVRIQTILICICYGNMLMFEEPKFRL